MAGEIYQNPLRRFIFRRNWLRRVKARLSHYWRKLAKDCFDDYRFVLQGRDVRTILDVGANIGFVTNQFRQDYPAAKVYSFEPNPVVFQRLSAAHADSGKVTPVNKGVADVSGTLTFNVNANTGTSSFLEPTEYHRSHQAKDLLEPIEIPVTSIDEFTAENQISHVNVLKLDIEGYELKALQGATRLMKEQAIDLMLIEVSVTPQYEGQPLFHEITSYLLDNRYHLYNLDAFVYQETGVRQATIGNAIYISEAMRTWLEETHGKDRCGW